MAEHGCTCRLPGSLPTGIFLKKLIPGPVKILSHGSPGPTGYMSTGNPGTCRYPVVVGLENSVCSDKQQLVAVLVRATCKVRGDTDSKESGQSIKTK